MLTSGELGLASWRDGGLTVHDLKDPAQPEAAIAYQLVAAVPGRHAYLATRSNGRKLAVVADEANAEKVREGPLHHLRARHARAAESGADRHAAPRRATRDWCAAPGTFGPHNLHENRPNSYQSEDLIFATYNNAGVRIFRHQGPVRTEGSGLLDSRRHRGR